MGIKRWKGNDSESIKIIASEFVLLPWQEAILSQHRRNDAYRLTHKQTRCKHKYCRFFLSFYFWRIRNQIKFNFWKTFVGIETSEEKSFFLNDLTIFFSTLLSHMDTQVQILSIYVHAYKVGLDKPFGWIIRCQRSWGSQTLSNNNLSNTFPIHWCTWLKSLQANVYNFREIL